MKFGLNLPNFGSFSDVRRTVEFAVEAEQAGWDGLFLWDHLVGEETMGPTRIDPWILLAAIASRTRHLRLGPMVTPLPRRRPWKLARETVTLDHLSSGRLVLGLGLGFPPEEFTTFGEEADERVRAQKLDEGLEILTGLWSGEPFSFHGRHYRVEETTFLPRPLQRPRIPIWIAGVWPHRAPLRRAARWDGVFPIDMNPENAFMPTVPVAREILSYVREHRSSEEPFDFILAGQTEADRAAEKIGPYAEVGATWWLETISDWLGPWEAMRERMLAGPPRLES